MKHILITSLVVLSIFGCIVACKKAIPTDNRDYVMEAHPWKLVDSTVNGVSIPLRDCDKNAVYNFYATQQGTITGTVLCDSQYIVSSDGQPDSLVTISKVDFHWYVDNDQRYVEITNYGNPNYNPVWEFLYCYDNEFKIKGMTHGKDGTLYSYSKTFRSL